ncbi:MAG: hypothetical protein ACR2I5_11525 [Candidatus Limnocylindria bacterium]
MSRDRSQYAPRPPSEREQEPEPPRGVGVFRYAGCGLGFSIALAVLVGVVLLLGYLRDDPGRNPAPDAYRDAVCSAFASLGQGTEALQRGAGSEASAERRAASVDVDDAVEAANATLTDLPEWEPGRSLDELLGSQIITLTNAAEALRSGDASEDLVIALEVDELARQQLESGRYGFVCGA